MFSPKIEGLFSEGQTPQQAKEALRLKKEAEEAKKDLRRKAEKKYRGVLADQKVSKKTKVNLDEAKVSRRDFLKLSALGIGAVATGYKVGEIASEIAEKAGWKDNNENVFEANEEVKEVEVEKESVQEVNDVEVAENEAEEEMKEIEFGEIKMRFEDLDVMRRLMVPSLEEKFIFGSAEAGSASRYYIYKYQNNKERNLAFNAQKEINRIGSPLGNKFIKNGVPEKLKFLAIMESGWRSHAKSEKNAQGWYQFIPSTAKKYNLKNPHNLFESAEACARYFKDLLEKAKGDLELALCGYHGGFFWRYIEKINQEKKEPNHEAFLGFLQEKVNAEREHCLNDKSFVYTIKSKKDNKGKKTIEYLNEIASHYKLSVAEIERANPSAKGPLSKRMQADMKIVVPFNGENRKIRFRETTNGFRLNIAYALKFNGLMEALEICPARYVSREKVEGVLVAKN